MREREGESSRFFFISDDILYQNHKKNIDEKKSEKERSNFLFNLEFVRSFNQSMKNELKIFFSWLVVVFGCHNKLYTSVTIKIPGDGFACLLWQKT